MERKPSGIPRRMPHPAVPKKERKYGDIHLPKFSSQPLPLSGDAMKIDERKPARTETRTLSHSNVDNASTVPKSPMQSPRGRIPIPKSRIPLLKQDKAQPDDFKLLYKNASFPTSKGDSQYITKPPLAKVVEATSIVREYQYQEDTCKIKSPRSPVAPPACQGQGSKATATSAPSQPQPRPRPVSIKMQPHLEEIAETVTNTSTRIGDTVSIKMQPLESLEEIQVSAGVTLKATTTFANIANFGVVESTDAFEPRPQLLEPESTSTAPISDMVAPSEEPKPESSKPKPQEKQQKVVYSHTSPSPSNAPSPAVEPAVKDHEPVVVTVAPRSQPQLEPEPEIREASLSYSYWGSVQQHEIETETLHFHDYLVRDTFSNFETTSLAPEVEIESEAYIFNMPDPAENADALEAKPEPELETTATATISHSPPEQEVGAEARGDASKKRSIETGQPGQARHGRDASKKRRGERSGPYGDASRKPQAQDVRPESGSDDSEFEGVSINFKNESWHGQAVESGSTVEIGMEDFVNVDVKSCRSEIVEEFAWDESSSSSGTLLIEDRSRGSMHSGFQKEKANAQINFRRSAEKPSHPCMVVPREAFLVERCGDFFKGQLKVENPTNAWLVYKITSNRGARGKYTANPALGCVPPFSFEYCIIKTTEAWYSEYLSRGDRFRLFGLNSPRYLDSLDRKKFLEDMQHSFPTVGCKCSVDLKLPEVVDMDGSLQSLEIATEKLAEEISKWTQTVRETNLELRHGLIMCNNTSRGLYAVSAFAVMMVGAWLAKSFVMDQNPVAAPQETHPDVEIMARYFPMGAMWDRMMGKM